MKTLKDFLNFSLKFIFSPFSLKRRVLFSAIFSLASCNQSSTDSVIFSLLPAMDFSRCSGATVPSVPLGLLNTGFWRFSLEVSIRYPWTSTLHFAPFLSPFFSQHHSLISPTPRPSVSGTSRASWSYRTMRGLLQPSRSPRPTASVTACFLLTPRLLNLESFLRSSVHNCICPYFFF